MNGRPCANVERQASRGLMIAITQPRITYAFLGSSRAACYEVTESPC